MRINKHKCISAQVRKCTSGKKNEKGKIFLIIISFFGLVVLLGGCAKQEIKNIDSKGVNIICFGDSLTFGYGADIGGDYPTLLAKIIKIPVINAGVDGDTSIEGLKRIKSEALDKNPLLVIIEFSGNDFLKHIPVEITLGNVEEMINQVQANGAMAALVDISAGMILGEYRAKLSKLARHKGAIYIPSILEGIVTNPSLKSDFLHPNSNGYNIIAQRVYRRIIPYLKKRIK